MKLIKKISLLLVCLVMLVPVMLQISVQARQPANYPMPHLPFSGVVNASTGLRVRSGPSTNHPQLAIIPNGRAVHIDSAASWGDDTLWFRVYFNGLTRDRGYVSAAHITLPATTSRWVFQVSGSAVNYRRAANTDNATNHPIATLSQNTILPRASDAGISNGFRNVVYRGLGNGWMYNAHLRSAPLN
ncbi:MAG: SH3 domain-containing protein [Oscillospiraceae bacterium]|nr:SH3 domain-containing protein [Oscillospiraceae bacterium]MCL2279117.1 SH3 domain-containing protein [Oscillospiraceae bacterium]